MRYAHPGTEGALVSFKTRYGNYIGGEFVAPVKGQYFTNTSPVNGLPIAEFPRSTEYLLAKGNVRPQPSAWLLEGIYPFPTKASVQERSVPAKSQGDASRDATSSGTARLQVGWFSRRENAQSLSSVLKGKGFSASLDEQAASDGSARWAVIVEASGDWTKTQAQLKDLGYESYLLP